MERTLPPSSDGSVLLDVGGDVRALLLRTSPALDGAEIDLYPGAVGEVTTHGAVRARKVVTGVTDAALYPNLKAGTYVLEGSRQRVTITGGPVTEVDYPLGSAEAR